MKKRIVSSLVLVMLVVVLLDITSYADVASFGSSGNSNSFDVYVCNITKEKRYASLSFSTYDSDWKYVETVKSWMNVLNKYGTSDDRHTLTYMGTVTHIKAAGSVYNSSVPASGIAQSYSNSLK